MLKSLRVYLAKQRFIAADVAASAYNRGDNWHVTVQTALNLRRDRAAAAYAAAIAA